MSWWAEATRGPPAGSNHDPPPPPGRRRELPSPSVSNEPLREYRESIDNIDAALVFLLAERFKITKKVGAYKASAGLPASDPDREAAQIGRLRGLAAEARLDPEFSEKFLRFIVDEVIRHHQREAEVHGATTGD